MLHLALRGCRRQPAFLGDHDRACLLAVASALARRLQVAVHAYALLDDRIHLLASAADGAAPVRLWRQMLACHRLAWRRRHRRPPPDWLDSLRVSGVDSVRQLLVVHRFIENLPVSAGLVHAPAHYRWSSARASLGTRLDRLLTWHPAFLALAATPGQRALVWSGWLARDGEDVPRRLAGCLARDQALGAPALAGMLARLAAPAAIDGAAGDDQGAGPGALRTSHSANTAAVTNMIRL